MVSEDVLHCCNLPLLCTHFYQICLCSWWFSTFTRENVEDWQEQKKCGLVTVIAKHIFQARKDKSEERTMSESSMPSYTNYLKLPPNSVIFHKLPATAKQRCMLWLHWLSLEVANSRESGIFDSSVMDFSLYDWSDKYQISYLPTSLSLPGGRLQK